jgi:hypothetical protein
MSCLCEKEQLGRMLIVSALTNAPVTMQECSSEFIVNPFKSLRE